MWLLRGWKLDEIEDKSSSTEKLNSYKNLFRYTTLELTSTLNLTSRHIRLLHSPNLDLPELQSHQPRQAFRLP